MLKSIVIIFAALWFICPSYAASKKTPESYVQNIIKSTTAGTNIEENLFDSVLLKDWIKLTKKKNCFELPGLDSILTEAQDSDAHNIKIFEHDTTRIGSKVRATYTVFEKKMDKDFYLVEQNGSLKIHDVCNHPSELGDNCYGAVLKRGECDG